MHSPYSGKMREQQFSNINLAVPRTTRFCLLLSAETPRDKIVHFDENSAGGGFLYAKCMDSRGDGTAHILH
jgi:hypothetical protein